MTLILGNDVTYKIIRFHFFVYFLFYHIELEFFGILIFYLKVLESFIQECLMGVWGAKLGGFGQEFEDTKGKILGMN
jgi:hypothetical protein